MNLPDRVMTAKELRYLSAESTKALLRDVLCAGLKNPLVVSVGLYLLVEGLHKPGFWAEIKTDAVQAAVFAAPLLLEMAKSGVLKDVLSSGKEGLGTLAGLAPLLAAVA